MSRIVEGFDGLAVLGSATFGPLSSPTPGLIWEHPPIGSGSPGPLLLKATRAPPGRRHLVIAQGGAEVALEFPIPAPEITGELGVAVELPHAGWLLHAPIPSAEWARVRGQHPAWVVLANARELWARGEPFVAALAELRRELGAEPVLWAPRVALPHRLALLAYLSVDLADVTEGLFAAANGTHLDATLGALDRSAAERERECNCPGCARDGPSDPSEHAVESYRAELARVRAAARSGRLRELVEARLPAEPTLAEMLRYADRLLADRLDERTAVIGSGSRTYVLRESFRRPEVARFRRRFLERYRPPRSKRVLLLVPCSRTKPYRASRSHRRLRNAIGEPRGLEQLHVVSVTSPLGVVPQELEDTYPARHYDIPVTGEWSEEEREAVTAATSHVIRSGNYQSVIVHLDPGEYAFVRPAIPEATPSVWTMADDRTTSPPALSALRDAVHAALDALPPSSVSPLAIVREELAVIAAFQYGADAAHLLFGQEVRLHGRPWFQRISERNGRDLATWQETRGLLHLSVPGAERMWPARPLIVEVASDVALQGDLFTPGVVRADPAIRSGDDVLLARDGQLIAVGTAEIGGPLMMEFRRGLAVRVRHRAHPVPSGPPTAT